jgi:hypothetical protein
MLRTAFTITATIEELLRGYWNLPYRPYVICGEGLEPSDTARRGKIPNENLNEIEGDHSNVDCALLSNILSSLTYLTVNP